MLAIIWVVIAVGLFSVFMFAGAGYINYDRIFEMEHESKIQSALVQVSSAISQYDIINSRLPSQWADIVPSYTSEPKLPNGLIWDSLVLDSNTQTLTLCMSGSIQEPVYNALVHAQSDLDANTFAINTTCGATSNMVKPSSFPSTVTATYRFR